jgi:hypothetical protein
MGRVLFAGTAVVLFVLAAIVLLATGGGERLAGALGAGGLACLATAFLIYLGDTRR